MDDGPARDFQLPSASKEFHDVKWLDSGHSGCNARGIWGNHD
jgi:hypothetical protein